MLKDSTLDGGRDWPVYRCEVSVAPITLPNVYGYYVAGPAGCCEVVRAESGDWWLFNAFSRYCHPIKVGHNGNWGYQFAMSLARRIAARGTLGY